MAKRSTTDRLSFSWDEVAAARLAPQHLDRRRPRADLVAVVGSIAGLHAQLMSSAVLSLWARVDGLTPDDLDRALWKDRTLVKLWAMRGTLHVLPATEHGLWQSALSTYTHFLKPAWTKASGVSPAELDTLIAAVAAALDGPPLTRIELARAVADLTGSAALGEKLLGSWGSLLKPASFRGALCFGPNKGQNVTFTRPDQWLPRRRQRQPDPDQSLDTIVRRFLAAYGPADRDDFARWWAMSPAAAGKRMAGLGDELCAVDVGDWSGWLRREDLPALQTGATAAVKTSVRLLPAFDPWIIGATRQAGHLMTGGGANRPRVYRNQGWISAVILVGGRVEGIWRHEKKGNRLVVDLEPFGQLGPKVTKAVEAEAERLASFMEGALTLNWV